MRRRLVVGTALIMLASTISMSAVALELLATGGTVARQVETAQRVDEIAEGLIAAVHEQRAALDSYQRTQTPEILERHRIAVDDQRNDQFALFAVAADDPELLAATRVAAEAISSWRSRWADPTLARLGVAGPASEPGTVHSQLSEAVDAALERLDDLADVRQVANRDRIQQMAETTALFLGMTIVFALAFIPAIGLWLVRSVSSPLERLIVTAERLRNGESVSFSSTRRDEIGVLASALEKLQIEREARLRDVQQDVEEANAFNQLSELMTFATSEPELVDASVVTLADLVPSPRGTIALVNPSNNRLVVGAVWGNSGPESGTLLDIDRPERCPGIRRGSVYVARDVTNSRTVRCPGHRTASGSVMCVPLLATGQTVGVIHLEAAEPDAFDIERQRLALRVAEQTALALANSRLVRTLEGLALTDSLTKLHNARFFDPFLERELATARRENRAVGVLMLDLDHFKQFNDTHGHPAGDEALKAFATAIVGVLRESDTAARYGGEEFVIAIPDADLAAVENVAEKVRSAVEDLVVDLGPGRHARLTASIGAASTVVSGYDRMGLLRLADQALYRAKRAGRNRVEVADRPADTRTASLDRRSGPDGAPGASRGGLEVVTGGPDPAAPD